MIPENGQRPAFSQQQINAIKQSKEARLLLEKLQKNGAPGMSQASDAFQKGDYGKAAALLRSMMDAPDTEALLQELSRKIGRA